MVFHVFYGDQLTYLGEVKAMNQRNAYLKVIKEFKVNGDDLTIVPIFRCNTSLLDALIKVSLFGISFWGIYLIFSDLF